MYNADIPPEPWVDYLNTAKVQNAIGVDINYTSTYSPQVGYGFDYTGDHVYPELLEDLEAVVGYGVRVALIYGDAVSGTPSSALTPIYQAPPYLTTSTLPLTHKLTHTRLRTTSATGSAAKPSR